MSRSMPVLWQNIYVQTVAITWILTKPVEILTYVIHRLIAYNYADIIERYELYKSVIVSR